MKATPKQFALSLYEAVDGKPAGAVKAAVKKFAELLAKENQLAAAEKIINEFGKIWNEQRAIVEAEITGAREPDRELVELLKSHIAELSGAKEVVASQKTDKNILGGVIIRYGDKILDGSLKTALADLKNKMVK